MRRVAELLIIVGLSCTVLHGQRVLSRRPVMELGVGGGSVHAVAFSPDGKWLASGGGRGHVVLWEVASRKQKRRFVVQPRAPGPGEVTYDSIDALAFSPDGKRLAALGSKLVVFDRATGEVLLQRPAGSDTALAFTPVGHVAYFVDRHVTIVDPATGKVAAKIKTLSARRLAFEDGKLVVARPNGFVERFSVPQGKCLDTKIHFGALTGYARVGDKDVACYRDGRVLVENKRWVRDEKRCDDIDVAPDGKRIAVATGTGGVSVCDANGRFLYELGDDARIGALDVAFHPSGLLAAACVRGGVRLWKEKELVAVLGGHDGPTRSMAFSPDGNYLGVTGVSSLVVDVRRKKRVTEWSKPGLWIAGCQGPELGFLTLGELTIWHASAQRAVRKHELLTIGLPEIAALSPDRRFLAYGGRADPPRLLDLGRNKLIPLGKSFLEGGAFHWHPTGAKLLVSARTDEWVIRQRIVDTAGAVKREVQVDQTGARVPWSGCFSPSGERFASVTGSTHYFFNGGEGDGAGVRLWGEDETRPLATAEEKVRWFRFLSEDRAISHDGKMLQLWNAKTLAVIREIEIDGVRTIDRAVLSGNRQRLAVDSGGRVRIFDLR